MHKILTCPNHILRTLLPLPTAQNYSLRNRPHNRQLPDRISRITDCNFTVRMLYRNMYWLLYILDLRFVLFLCRPYDCGLTVRNKRICYVTSKIRISQFAYICLSVTVDYLVVNFSFNNFRIPAFSAPTLLVGRHEEHPARKNWVTRRWCGYMNIASASAGPYMQTRRPETLQDRLRSVKCCSAGECSF